ncbi:hypothetical protein MMA231_01239 [Asticcacaulis sp. MM231]|uniref:glycoside hydrolase family 25 protein n=1 Tax=Asticcacaulis sp. MM231 TaxID=3157666 RepID=UPI0032D5675A
MKVNIWASVCISAILSVTYGAHAQTVQYQDLMDDQSREQLAEYDLEVRGLQANKQVKSTFVFPADANDAVYGVDVSHHNGTVTWPTLAKSGVKFAYIKASQGAVYRDRTFSAHWSASRSAGIRHGAYHFLSAGVDGQAQAGNFLGYLKSVGGLKKDDLVPVLDMEWDVGTCADGSKTADRWDCPENKGKAGDVAAAWVEAVKQFTGKTPVIYTAKSWWDVHVGKDKRLQDVGIWIVDVNLQQDRKKDPVSVAKHPVRAWQFTSIATVEKQGFDANKLLDADFSNISFEQDVPVWPDAN